MLRVLRWWVPEQRVTATPRGVPQVPRAARHLPLCGAVVSLLLCGYCAPTQAQTTTLAAAADTYLKSGSPNQNQGSDTILRVQQSGTNRTLARFSQTEIAATVGSGTLAAATLELYIQTNANNWGSSGRTVDAYRLTTDWSELGATWNCGIDLTPANAQADCNPQWDGGSVATTPTASRLHTNNLTGWIQFEVTSDVRAFLSGSANHGWLVRKTDEGQSGQVDYTAREGTAGNAPRLVLVVESPVTDPVPPALQITAPDFPVVFNTPTPSIGVAYSDGGSGVDLGSLHVRVDGVDLTGCATGATSATCIPPALAAGTHTITAELRDNAGNLATASYQFELFLGEGPASVTLPVRWDTYLKQGSPNQNQGAEGLLRIQDSGNNRVLLTVDEGELFDTFGDTPLSAATLELYIADNGNNWGTSGGLVAAHRVDDEWSELGATWNCPDDTDPTNQQPDCDVQWDGGTFEATPTATRLHTNGLTGWIQFDVTADLRAFRNGTANFGWLLKKLNEAQAGQVSYTAREGATGAAAGQAPRVVLVFDPSAPDDVAPQLQITAPSIPIVIGEPQPAVSVSYSDGGGLDLTSLQVLVDATDVTASCSVGPNAATCTAPTLAAGTHTITAQIRDLAGNQASATNSFVLLLGEPAETVTLPATADTYLRHGAPNQNQGAQTILRVKSSGSNRALVRFDQQVLLAAIGTAPVPAAILELYIERNGRNWGTTGRTVDAHLLTADWDELGATWHCATDSNIGNQQPDCGTQWEGGTFAPAPSATVLHTRGLTGWIQFDVTADVNAFRSGTANYGWLIKKTNEKLAGLVKYTAKDGTAGFGPRLVIAFQVSPTATPAVTPSAADTQTPTATASSTVTPTEAPTATPTETPTSTPTPTNTPVPPGVVVGEVFDDATAQPQADVLVRVLVLGDPAPTTNTNTSTNPDGRYTLTAEAGEQWIELTKTGYTRSLRRVTVPPGGPVRARDARLTLLAPAVSVGAGGGTVTTKYMAPDHSGDVQLIVPAGVLTENTQLRLTTLSPQGLVAPVPLGWSVLLGIDLQTATSTPTSTTVRVPLALLESAGAAPVVTAVWDDQTRQWLGGPVPTSDSNALAIAFPATSHESPVTSHQLALLIADTAPAAPPAAVEGAPLQGVSAVSAQGDDGMVAVVPPQVVTGTDEHAFVIVRLQSPTLPSGTDIEAHLSELYDLRDGTQTTGPTTRQDIALYRFSPTLSLSNAPTDPGSHGAWFHLVPSQSFTIAELTRGRADIDMALPDTNASRGVVDASGGVVGDPSGPRVVIPPGATTGTSVITVRPVAPAALPGTTAGRPDFVGAIEVQVDGSTLQSDAAYRFGFSAAVLDGAYVIGRLVPGEGRIDLVGFGHGDGGLVTLDACPSGLGFCLGDPSTGSGQGFGGTYVVFSAAGTVTVSGTTADSNGARAGIAVRSDRVAVVSVTDAQGRFALPAPVGVVSTLSADDRDRDLHGSVRVTPDGQTAVVTADIELVPAGPSVTAIDPPNHGSEVPLTARVTVTFSEPVAPATVSPTTVQLLQVSGVGGQVSGSLGGTGVSPVSIHLSLDATGTQLLITPDEALASTTVYRLTLTNAITDVHGAPLAVTPGLEPPAGSDASAVLSTSFTTELVFRAAALPPNTLRIALPVDAQGQVVLMGPNGQRGAEGQVFVCGGAFLAAPDTDVVIVNDGSGQTFAAHATDNDGVSGSATCDALFPGRCDTSQPGSFCGVLDAALADKVLVQVRDVLNNTVTLDSGNMRDERTGAEVIPPAGGVVRFPADPRYQALVPDGAFPHPTLIQITPITMTGVGLDLADYPYLTEVDPDFFALSGAVKLDFEGTAQRNLDITVPAPAGATTDDQYLALQHINFRNRDEMTLVDIASFDPANGVIATGEASPFTLIIQQGVIGVVKALQCISFAKVVAFVGDLFNNGYLSSVFGPQLPFPLVAGAVNNLAVPVACERPVQVELKTFDDQPIATAACPGNSAPKGGFCPLPPLSDDTKPPLVEGASVSEGDTDADPLSPLSVSFDEPLSSAKCELTDEDHGITVKGRCEVTANVVTFTPDIRLRYSTRYTFRVFEIVDQGQQPGDEVVTHFTTFTPRILQHIAMDARDVVWVDPVSLGRSPCDDLIAVAEGNAQRQDFEGGIKVFDVTDLSQAPKLLGEHATAGVDRAVAFGAGAITTQSGPSGSTTPANHPGPFLMSVDGPGDPDRFGVWRLFELSGSGDTVSLNQVAIRFVSQSKLSYDTFREDPSSVLLGSGTKFIPNDLGVPVGVASFGSTASYIANTPFLGLQAVVVDGMNTDVLTGPQIDGQVPGLFRAVTTYRQHVLAAGQEGSDNKLVLADPQLNVTDTYTYAPSAGDRPVGMVGLGHWLSHPALGSATQEDRDYAVVLPKGAGLSVIRTADAGAGMKFNTDEQLTLKTPGGRPGAAVGDPLTQMLFVADGNAGLTIIDLATPSGLRDEDGDGYDDRVLGSVDLAGARAHQVTVWRDFLGETIVGVATTSGGLYLIDASPPQPGLGEPAAAKGVGQSPQPGTSATPCRPEIRFLPDRAGQAFGFDQSHPNPTPTPGWDHDYLSLDQAPGETTTIKVDVEAAKFKQNTFWLESNDPELFVVDGGALTAPVTTLTIRSTVDPAFVTPSNHLRGTASVRVRGVSGPKLPEAVLNVELYKRRKIGLVRIFRIVAPGPNPVAGCPASTPTPNATASVSETPTPAVGGTATPTIVYPSPPPPLATYGDIQGQLNAILQQAVTLVDRVRTDDECQVATWDLPPYNGALDVPQIGGEGPEWTSILQSLPVKLDPSELWVVYVDKISGDAGITIRSANEVAVTNADNEFLKTLAHELLHTASLGNLCDLTSSDTTTGISQRDNVMYESTGGTDSLLRFRGQMVNSACPRSQPDMQWNLIVR